MLINTVVPGSFKRQRLIPNEKDILPPFSSLTNDEDRERKAELKPVGTYIVVVNPASFVNLEEYRDTLPEDPYPVPSPSYVGPSTNEVRAITQIDSPVGSSNNAEEVNVSSYHSPRLSNSEASRLPVALVDALSRP